MRDILIAYQEGQVEFEEVLTEAKKERIISNTVSRYKIRGFDTSDLKQIATWGLWEAAETYKRDSKKSAKNFIYMVVKRKLLNVQERLNRIKRRAFQEAAYLDEPLFDNSDFCLMDMIDAGGEPTKELILKELSKESKKRLSKLEYKVFKLRLKGYSYKEVANKLGRNFKSVDNALCRIKKKINLSEVI